MMKNNAVFDFSALRRAVSSLEEALTTYQQDTDNLFVRDACIQRFEYTYELAAKMLKRYLEYSEAVPEQVDHMAFPTLIRTACEQGLLLNSWDQWSVYRSSRNLTSHTYNETNALKVCDVMPLFLEEMAYLLAQLSSRLEAL